MSAHSSSQEVLLSAHDLIITKTNTKGHITYANRMFMTVSEYPEERLLGEAHNIVRHPDMPRGVFRLMWKTLSQGHEFFGVIKNYTACHNYYWVFANITPDYAKNRQIQGYYSVRRQASRAEIVTMSEIYQKMRTIEQQHGKQQGPDAAMSWLLNYVRQQGYTSYEGFILSLHLAHQGTKQR